MAAKNAYESCFFFLLLGGGGGGGGSGKTFHDSKDPTLNVSKVCAQPFERR